MTTKPILFSTPMVQAILEGRKTQTRRVIKDLKEIKNPIFDLLDSPDDFFSVSGEFKNGDIGELILKKPICVGDILWVRETWSLRGWDPNEGSVSIKYKDGKVCDFYPDVDGIGDWVDKKADKLLAKGILEEDPDDEERLQFVEQKILWEPSIFMPKWATRIFLEVTNVRVERLQDIQESDALAEGIRYWTCADDTDLLDIVCKDYVTGERNLVSAYSSFRTLWLSINGEPSWDANPWVWVYDFKKVEKPAGF